MAIRGIGSAGGEGFESVGTEAKRGEMTFRRVSPRSWHRVRRDLDRPVEHEIGHQVEMGRGTPTRRVLAAVLALVLAVVVSVATIEDARAENRIALVIGNAAYARVPLANPVNDARAVAANLARTGFAVTTLTDADQAQMRRAILAFGRSLRAADSVGLFYYAGHGVQVDGENYLVPIGADITDATEVPLQGVGLGELLKTMERSQSRLNIAILDACRDNPFPVTRLAVTRGLAAARGLAPVEAPSGTIIAYATGPGQVALDGTGPNSPYSGALAENLLETGIPIEEMFRRTRRAVLAATENKQVPWEHSSLTGEFFFRPKMASPDGHPAGASGFDERSLAELAAWQRIKDSADRKALQAHIDRYPDGNFAELAVLRMERLAQPVSPWTWIVTGGTAAAASRSEQADAYEAGLKIESSAKTSADFEKAADLYRRAAARGLAAAMYRLGRLAELGQIGAGLASGEASRQDLVAAVDWYRKAVAQGFAPAMAALGALYERGDGVPLDSAEALRLYRLGAEAGDPASMASLAFLLNQGRGVTRDDKEARRWYALAADRGDRRAMFNLALMLARGEGGAADRVGAVRLLQLAAERGHAGAQRELAYHFDEGRGVARDPIRAADYLLAALASGSKELAREVSQRPGVWSYATRRAVQRQLAERGLYRGPAHGIFNRATKAALKQVGSGA